MQLFSYIKFLSCLLFHLNQRYRSARFQLLKHLVKQHHSIHHHVSTMPTTYPTVSIQHPSSFGSTTSLVSCRIDQEQPIHTPSGSTTSLVPLYRVNHHQEQSRSPTRRLAEGLARVKSRVKYGCSHLGERIKSCIPRRRSCSELKHFSKEKGSEADLTARHNSWPAEGPHNTSTWGVLSSGPATPRRHRRNSEVDWSPLIAVSSAEWMRPASRPRQQSATTPSPPTQSSAPTELKERWRVDSHNAESARSASEAAMLVPERFDARATRASRRSKFIETGLEGCGDENYAAVLGRLVVV